MIQTQWGCELDIKAIALFRGEEYLTAHLSVLLFYMQDGKVQFGILNPAFIKHW